MTSLDRTADGQIQRCDECSRDYRGESWMDYCAECRAKQDQDSPLNKLWACLTCNEKFPLGDVRPGAGAGAYDPMPCPKCGSRTITPADGAIRETSEYYGEIGTKQ